ncbi:uncharacterized protein LOC135464142 [Liolophura sinensis]|uniref:uncharacterized protein LOC135464142 n=1 Tax=Liolophura sinensis TaxID=3198878 RepID=UPI00315914A9
MEHVSEIVKSSLARSNRKRKVFSRKQRPILPASALPMRPKPVAINPLNKINLPVKKLLEIRRNMSIPVLLREPNVGTESAAWETTLSDTAKVISHKTTEAKAKEKLAPAVQLVKETFPVGPPKQSTRRKGKKPVKYSSVVSSVSDFGQWR